MTVAAILTFIDIEWVFIRVMNFTTSYIRYVAIERQKIIDIKRQERTEDARVEEDLLLYYV